MYYNQQYPLHFQLYSNRFKTYLRSAASNNLSHTAVGCFTAYFRKYVLATQKYLFEKSTKIGTSVSKYFRD